MLRSIKLSGVVLFAILLLGCSGGNGVKEVKRLAFDSQQRQLSANCNDFSFNLLNTVAEGDQSANIIVSPLSASMLLGMVMNGADGNTLAQMRLTLGFGDEFSTETVNDYYRQLIDALPALDRTNKVMIANSMWVQDGFDLLASFTDVNHDYFYAKTDNVDFHNPKTADKINKWASDNTKGLIKEVVKADEIADMMAVLANALYFKGIWDEQFEKTDTRNKDFTTAAGQTGKVPTMHLTKELFYTDTEEGQLLQMDYKEHQYCMDIYLPAKGVDLRESLRGLTSEVWGQWLENMREYEVSVALPKFECRYNSEFNKPLQQMGITDAFSAFANFSRMSSTPLYLSLVKQFCYMKVDEEGTEAAAVTWAGVEKCSAPPPLEHRDFIADHPFAVFIREKQFGTILFTAIVGNP